MLDEELVLKGEPTNDRDCNTVAVEKERGYCGACTLQFGLFYFSGAT